MFTSPVIPGIGRNYAKTKQHRIFMITRWDLIKLDITAAAGSAELLILGKLNFARCDLAWANRSQIEITDIEVQYANARRRI